MRLKLRAVLALATIGATPANAQQAAAPAIPSAADFGAPPVISAPVLSPDGKLVAARGIRDGKSFVLLVVGAGADRAAKWIAVPDKHKLQWVRWAGSKRLLVSLSKADSLMGEDVRVTRLAMLDLGGAKPLVLGPQAQGVDGDDLVHVDPEGRFVLLSTQATIYEYPSVFRIDLSNGKLQRVVAPQDHVWGWYADSVGVVRAGLGIVNDKWWLLYRDGPKANFARSKRRDVGRSDSNIDQFVPVFGTDQGFAIAAGASGRFGLYRYDFTKDELGERLYENPVVDIDDFDLARDGQVSSVTYTDDKPEVVWFDPELKKLQARIDRALPGTVNRVLSTSTDKMRMLIWSGSAEDPGVYRIYDRTTNRMDDLASTHEGLLGKRLRPMQAVRYKARDGLEIRGYLTLPEGSDGKGLPLVVMPHGGPFARDRWGFEPWAQYLASKGYAVLQPNFRGSTGFGSDFVKRGTGQWGRGMQDDVDDGVKWLVDAGKVDAKRVCIMGASFGGYAAMWAAVRNPELYRCAISFAGISDVAAMLRYDRRTFSAPRYFRDWRARVQGDKTFELDQISPIKRVEKMTVPILIAHGSDDDNVPLSQSRRLHEALLKLGRAHEYVVYPKEGHGLDDPVHATDFLTRVGAFLDVHNPAGKRD